MLTLEIAAGVFLGLLTFTVFSVVGIWALSQLTIPDRQRLFTPRSSVVP